MITTVEQLDNFIAEHIFDSDESLVYDIAQFIYLTLNMEQTKEVPHLHEQQSRVLELYLTLAQTVIALVRKEDDQNG